MDDTETKHLRKLIERPQKVTFWGLKYTITPLLISHIFGDGKQLVCVTPLATRPNYFVVRVDSSVKSVLDSGDWGWGRKYLIDAIMDAQEDEYGYYEHDDVELSDWPAVDWGIGCSWGKPFPIEEW